MKKSVFFLFFFMPALLFGDTASELFLKGNEAYKQGRYGEAARFYEEILSSGIKNGFVHYNLGNAYFKQNDLGRAILNYQRARIFLPADGDVKFNLRFADSIKQDNIPEGEFNPFTRMILFLYGVFDVNTLFRMVYFLFLLLIASLIFGWNSKNVNHQTINARIQTPAAVIFAVFLFVLVLKVHETATSRHAVVLAHEIRVKSGPSDTYTDIFTLHAGSRVAVRKENNGWLLISLPNGYSGWAEKSGLEKI